MGILDMVERIPRRLMVLLTCYADGTDKPRHCCIFFSSISLSKNVEIKIYRSIILLVVIYGCESWSFTLRKECRVRVYKNRVLSWIFGPKSDEVTGEWRRLHKKELYALYSSPNTIWVIKSRRLRWAGHIACMGERIGF